MAESGKVVANLFVVMYVGSLVIAG